MTKWIGLIVLPLLGGLAWAATSSKSDIPVYDGLPTLKLGMNGDKALVEMRSVDPGAMTGILCDYSSGVNSYVNHMGEMWRLMAHIDSDEVNQISLARSTRKDIKSDLACERKFSEVAAHYSQRFPESKWKENRPGQKSGDLNVVHKSVLADGTKVRMSARRGQGKSPLCEIEISFARGVLLPEM